MNEQIRFVRINGRVVPIRSKKAQTAGGQTQVAPGVEAKAVQTAKPYSLATSLRTNARIGLSSGALGIAAGVLGYSATVTRSTAALIMAKMAGYGSVGLALAGTGRSVGQAYGARKRGDSAFSSLVFHQGAHLAGIYSATTLGAASFGKLVRASVKTGHAARSAAKVFHSTVKPYSSAFAEFRRFRAAKHVKALRPLAGLLT